MGLESPKRLEQVKQIKPSRLLSASQIFLESGNHHKRNRMAKTTASQLPLRHKKAKPSSLYKLSKRDINSTRVDIRRAIFRYGVS